MAFDSLSAAEAATNLRDSAAARFQPSAYSAQLSEVSPKLLRKMQRSHGEKTYPCHAGSSCKFFDGRR
jgi:hypothetical protein